MKATILAAVALALGVAAGVYCTHSELQPTDVPLAIRVVHGATSELLVERSTGAPKAVVVDGTRYNFGVMDRHDKRSHEFVVRNEGQAPLTLVRGQTSCKCTTSNLVDDQLAPGAETRIRLEWTAAGADTSFEQSAQFTTNDPLRPVLSFLVYGTVVDTVRAEPGTADLGEISATEASETSVKLFGYRDTPVEVTKVEWLFPETSKFYELSFEPLPAEQLPAEPPATSGLTMKIAIKPGLPIGPLDQSIRLRTNLQPDEVVEVILNGSVVGDIRLVGQGTSTDRLFVSLPDSSGKQGLKHVVYLLVKGSHRDETEFRVSSVEPAAELKATLGEAIRDNPRVVRFPLTLEIPPGTTAVSRVSPGSYAKVKLETTHPQYKEVVIEVRYLVQD
jgi:hypothetical protein